MGWNVGWGGKSLSVWEGDESLWEDGVRVSCCVDRITFKAEREWKKREILTVQAEFGKIISIERIE